MANKPELGLQKLINQVKGELAASSQEPDLFFIEDITLEINFFVSGDVNSGFNLGVVTLGSEVSEHRVQKVTVKLSPILSKNELKKKLSPDELRHIAEESAGSLFKGGGRPK